MGSAPTSNGAPLPEAARPAAILGIPQAIALVLGSIIGVGVFNLPASLTPYGPISVVALGPTTIGALALALLFASLASRMPADGGPYAYARAGFGNLVGFINAWLYWLTTWGGNAAIATGWVLLYLEHFVNTGHTVGFTIVLVLAGIWLAVGINLLGVASMGRVQLWTSILKFVPLLLVSVVGLAFIEPANFATWNLSGQSTVAAIGGAMALCLFSYIGVESAAVAAAQVRNPTRNVPRAWHARCGSCLRAFLDHGFRPGAERSAENGNCALCRRHDEPHRSSVGRGCGRTAGGDLRLRCAQWLDNAGRRDASRCSPGRPLPGPLRSAVSARCSGVRHSYLGRAGVCWSLCRTSARRASLCSTH